ncbi:hypothetical protein GCK72_001990 [Caenorhabditis remanei]|uniref:Uncharacterized protein n=1 Tax=Caenorhabditis remanei TaxID=31234 RepID=A0A6A5HWH0_CAERE|nr:hypothetical protein GCK72_001990 [Caenorhabditis remanei]KAF1770172.1 hypothetical protein GCK72_001990 [Caenorhabditis remanei]
MDYHVGPIGVEPPKLCCIPARPLVCVLAILGILRSICVFFETPTFTNGFFLSIFIFLDSILLIGAAKNREKHLSWSLKVVFVGIGFAALQLLIFPVIAASAVASGSVPHSYKMVESMVKMVLGGNQENFMNGVAAGYVVEIATILLIGVQTLKYVIVNRLWEYAKVTEGIL